MTFHNPTPEEIPQPYRERDAPVTSLAEALEVMGPHRKDAEAYLKGERPEPPTPLTLTARIQSARAMLMKAHSVTAPGPAPEPPRAPIVCPPPGEVASFGDLMARGIGVVSLFAERWPGDYRRLKSEQAQRLDPTGSRFHSSSIPAGINPRRAA